MEPSGPLQACSGTDLAFFTFALEDARLPYPRPNKFAEYLLARAPGGGGGIFFGHRLYLERRILNENFCKCGVVAKFLDLRDE
jgi:hypothetical protein